MAFRQHNAQWLGVYRASNSTYVRSGNPALAGGGSGYNTIVGFNSSAILNDINTSKVRPEIRLKYNCINAGTFDLGMHKQTSNKASNGIPFYRWTGRSFASNTGNREYDITDFPITFDGNNSFEEALNDGFHGIVLYGGVGASYGEANSIVIEIEGVWNEPPSAPTLTYPLGGETLSGEVTFTANAATDPENDSLTYQFYLKDGTKTHYFTRGGLSKIIDLSNYTETSTAKVGVRAYDGQSYGPWDESGVFTLSQNIAPSQPSLIEPVGGVSRDRTKTIRFLWDHNDDDPQSLFRFRWRIQGNTEWTTQQTVTTDELVAIPGNTFPIGNIEWQVQTEDQGGLVSPWSPTGLFLSTEQSDAPTILLPTNDSTIPTETLAVSWSSSGQEQYEVEVLDGDVTHWSIQRSSGNKGVTVGEPLTNNTTYTIRVRIADSGGLWSDWAEVTAITSFTPPTQAELDITANESNASIYVDISNPLPSGTQPDANYNDLYRRLPGEEWKRIAKDLPPDTGFMDYTPAGNVVYEYRVTTYGNNDTTMESVPVIGSVAIENTFLSIAEIPTTYIELNKVKPPSFGEGYNMTTMTFSGRKYPVAEFGEANNDTLSLDFLIEVENFNDLRYIVSSKRTLLYRDEQGEKRYVVIGNMNRDYLNKNYYNVSLFPFTVDYKEEV